MNQLSAKAKLSQMLDLSTLKKMASQQEYLNFAQTFLTNRFCKRLEQALRD